MSALDSDELFGLLTDGERIAVWLAAIAPELREPYRLGQELAEWSDRRARARAAEELRAAADANDRLEPGMADWLRARAAALAADEDGSQ